MLLHCWLTGVTSCTNPSIWTNDDQAPWCRIASLDSCLGRIAAALRHKSNLRSDKIISTPSIMASRSNQIWWQDIWPLNTLRPRKNGCHFADNIFKCIFQNENVWILTKISLKFVPKGPINKIPALVQVMAWCRPGNKPLSQPMMVRLPTHICITRPQWVNK